MSNAAVPVVAEKPKSVLVKMFVHVTRSIPGAELAKKTAPLPSGVGAVTGATKTLFVFR